MKRWRLGLHQLCKLVENSIYIVEKIVNGNSSEVWNEKEGLKLSSLRPHIELSFTHSQTLLLQIFRSPIKICYYFYIWLPLFWCTLALQYAKLTLQISSRRSSRIYVLLRQISSFYILGKSYLLNFYI